MPPKKRFRSVKRKKRRFGNNQYTKNESAAKKVVLDREKASESSGESECDEDHVETAEHQNTEKRLPASVRKLKEQDSDSSQNCISEEEIDSGGPEGFRFTDISVLASVFETLRCPLCKQGRAVLEEDDKAKMGLASLLILKF